jgi:hypothetical protein
MTFFLKSGDSKKEQPNDDGPKRCLLKACHNDNNFDVCTLADERGTCRNVSPIPEEGSSRDHIRI